MQGLAVHLRGSNQIAFFGQQVVQARGEIIAHLQRFDQHVFPCLRDHAAPVGHADDQRFGAGLFGFRQGHVREAHIGLAAFHAELANRILRAPVLDALGNFRGELVWGIAQKQQIRGLDHGGSPMSVDSRHIQRS